MKINDNKYSYHIETQSKDGSAIEFVDIETVEPIRAVGVVQDELDLINNKQIKRIEERVFDGSSDEHWHIDETRTSKTHVVAYCESVEHRSNPLNPLCETNRKIFTGGNNVDVDSKDTNYICTYYDEGTGLYRFYLSIQKDMVEASNVGVNEYDNDSIKRFFEKYPTIVWYVMEYPVEIPRIHSKGHLLTQQTKTIISSKAQQDGKVLPIIKGKVQVGDSEQEFTMDSQPEFTVNNTTEGLQIKDVTLEGVTLVNNAKGDNVKGTKELSHTRYGFEPFYDGSTTINNTVEGGYVSAKLYGDTMVNIVKPYGETPLLRATESIARVSDLLGENEDGVELLDGEITEGRIYGDTFIELTMFNKGLLNEDTGTINTNGVHCYSEKMSVPKKTFTFTTPYTFSKVVYYDSNDRKISHDWSNGYVKPVTSTPPANASYVRFGADSNGRPTNSFTWKYEDGTDVYNSLKSVVNPKLCFSNTLLDNKDRTVGGDDLKYLRLILPQFENIEVYNTSSTNLTVAVQFGKKQEETFVWVRTLRKLIPANGSVIFSLQGHYATYIGVVETHLTHEDIFNSLSAFNDEDNLVALTKTLNKLPNGVADYIDVVNKVHVQRVTSVTIDGSAIKSTGAIGNTDYRLEVSNAFNTNFTGGWGDVKDFLYTSPIVRQVRGYNKTIVFYPTDKNISLEDFKTALQSDPITVLYKLDTPIYTPLTEEEIAQLPLTAYKDGCVTSSSEQLTPSFEFRMQSSNRYQVDMLETGYYYLNAPIGNVKLGTTDVDVQQMPCIVKVDNVGTGDSGYRLKTSENFYKDILLNHEKGYLGIGNGVVQSDNSGRWASDFVELPINDTSLYVSEGTLIDVAFYNESQVFILGKAVGNVHSISNFNVPANAKYIRVSGKNEEMKLFICKQPITLAKLPSHRIPSSFTQGMKHKIDFGYWKGIKESKPSNLYVSDEEHILIKDVKLNRIEYGSIVVEDEYDVATGKLTKRVGQTLIDERHVNHFLVWNNNKGDYCAFFIYLDKTSVGVNNGKASGKVLNNILPSNVGGYLGTTNGINRIHSSGYIPFSLHKNILGVSDVNNVNEVKEAVKVFIKNHPVTLFYELAVPEITYFEQSKYVVRTKANSTNLQCWKNTGYLVPRVEPSYLSYPTILTPNTSYTVLHNRKNYEGSDKALTINLGGNTVTAQGDKTVITTPTTLSHSELQFIGGENTVEQVMVLHGDWTKKGKTVDYFEGMQSVVLGSHDGVDRPFITTSNNKHSTSIDMIEPIELNSLDTYDLTTGTLTRNTITRVLNGANEYEDWSMRNHGSNPALQCFGMTLNDKFSNNATANFISDTFAFHNVDITTATLEGFHRGGNDNSLFLYIDKSRLKEVSADGLKEWLSEHPVAITYKLKTPIAIKSEDMLPYTSTRPKEGNIISNGTVISSSYLNYEQEQFIMSPKPLGEGDSITWEKGSQSYVFKNSKEYIPLSEYNKPVGVTAVVDYDTQYVESVDGAEVVVVTPLKEKAVYERNFVRHEDNVIYPDMNNIDELDLAEVEYICGATWQNPNDLSDIQHLGTLREDGQYEITIGRSGDDEIRLFDGDTRIELDYEGIRPSEFELTYVNSGGVEVGKYGDMNHLLEDSVKDSKLKTGMVYGDVGLVRGLTDLVNTRTAQWYNHSDFNLTGTMDNTKSYMVLFDGDFPVSTLGFLRDAGSWNVDYNFKEPTKKGMVKLTPKQNFPIAGLRIRFDNNKDSSFKPTVNAMVFEYQDGISYIAPTSLTGFTVSNADNSQTIRYSLPTPITLSKVGDVMDSYDIISGVETRKIEKTVLDGSLSYIPYSLTNEYPDVMGGYIHFKPQYFDKYLPSFTNDVSMKRFTQDVFPGRLTTNEEGLIVTNEGYIKFAIKRSKLTSLDANGLKRYFSDNPITLFVAGIKTPQKIQHTLIPSIQTPQEPTFILPQSLKSLPNGICDRLYWDENKGHYCIEERVGEGTYVLKAHNSTADKKQWYTFKNQIPNLTNFNITQVTSVIHNNKEGFIQKFVIGTNLDVYLNYNKFNNVNEFNQYFTDNPISLCYPLNETKIIDLPHLNRKLELPTLQDNLLTGYRVVHHGANPQFGLTIPYKILNAPSKPGNLNFEMAIADYVLTWDDVKEARHYNIILNDQTIATVKEPRYNTGEEIYGYILVEAQNEIADNVSEELYVKTVPNAPAHLSVAHNPNTDWYDFEISFINTSEIAEFYTVKYCVDDGDWVEKSIPASEVNEDTRVLWNFSVYEIKNSIQVHATATNEVGTNDILPIATYYMSPTPQWTYRINSKEVFLRWVDNSPYDTQYKLRYSYTRDGITHYAYFEGDASAIGKMYETVLPLADDEEMTFAICIISEKENLYCKPVKASKELDPNIVPPKNFNYRWVDRGLIEFYWEDNYDCDIKYEYVLEHRLAGETEWIVDQQEIVATDMAGKGEIYRLKYQMQDLEEVRVKVRMRWAMNDTEWTEQLTTVFIPVEGNPPQWIRRLQTKEGLLVEWEAQQYVDSYNVYVKRNGKTVQEINTKDNSIIVDLDYTDLADIEIYEVTRFTGGVTADPSYKMKFRPHKETHYHTMNIYHNNVEKSIMEVSTIQKGSKERYMIDDINVTPDVKSQHKVETSITTPFTITYHPLDVDVHQKGSRVESRTVTQVSTKDVIKKESIEVLTFERITDKLDVNLNIYTPIATRYPVNLEVNKIRIVCFGDSLTSGFNKGRLAK